MTNLRLFFKKVLDFFRKNRKNIWKGSRSALCRAAFPDQGTRYNKLSIRLRAVLRERFGLRHPLLTHSVSEPVTNRPRRSDHPLILDRPERFCYLNCITLNRTCQYVLQNFPRYFSYFEKFSTRLLQNLSNFVEIYRNLQSSGSIFSVKVPTISISAHSPMPFWAVLYWRNNSYKTH